METPRSILASVVVAAATALLIVAATLPLFLNPVWVGFEQGRAEATAWTGFSEPELRAVTDAILADLVLGPPDFDAAVGGEPALNERERGHMRDVRGVFIGFFGLALALVVAALLTSARRRGTGRVGSWRAVRGGAMALIGVLAIGGLVSFVAFDALFEFFHRIFFAGGSYTFDPASERLVQLFPFRFWQETAIVLGAACIVIAAIVVVVANGRVSDLAGRAARPDGEVADGPTTLRARGSTR